MHNLGKYWCVIALQSRFKKCDFYKRIHAQHFNMKCKCVYWILSVKTVISYMEHLVCLPLLNDWLPASVGHWKARCQFKQLASWQICSIQNAFPGLTSGLTKPVFSGVWRGLDLSVPLCVCVFPSAPSSFPFSLSNALQKN